MVFIEKLEVNDVGVCLLSRHVNCRGGICARLQIIANKTIRHLSPGIPGTSLHPKTCNITPAYLHSSVHDSTTLYVKKICEGSQYEEYNFTVGWTSGLWIVCRTGSSFVWFVSSTLPYSWLHDTAEFWEPKTELNQIKTKRYWSECGNRQ